MIKDILGFIGGFLSLFVRVILIIALAAGGVYSFGTMFMVPFIWEGLTRLGITAGCVLGIIGLLRIGREKDDREAPTADDFRP